MNIKINSKNVRNGTHTIAADVTIASLLSVFLFVPPFVVCHARAPR